MAAVDVRTPDGGTAGSVELDEGMFGIEPNLPVLHQAVQRGQCLVDRRLRVHLMRLVQVDVVRLQPA